MALRQFIQSTKASSDPSAPKKHVSLRRSLGKLPKLSKEFIYGSVHNQPLPLSSDDASVGPSPVPSAHPSAPSGSPVAQVNKESIIEARAHQDEDSTKWSTVLNKAKRSSKLFQRSEMSNLLDNAETTDGAEDDSDQSTVRANSDAKAKQRSSIYDSLPLSSLFHPARFSNKRQSVTTESSQGDDWPTTPKSSIDHHSVGSYKPSSEFGLPRDPFERYDGHTMIENEEAHFNANEHRVSENEIWWNGNERLGEVNPDLSTFSEANNISTPPLSPKQRAKDIPTSKQPESMSLAHSCSSSFYVPAMGLNFPLPPSCTNQDVSQMQTQGIDVGEFEDSILARHAIRSIDWAYMSDNGVYSPPPPFYVKNTIHVRRRSAGQLKKDEERIKTMNMLNAFDSFLLGGSAYVRKNSKSKSSTIHPKRQSISGPPPTGRPLPFGLTKF